MPLPERHTFTKAERLCGKNDIDLLLKKGRYWRVSDAFRVCWLKKEEQPSRILISVPKKIFRRAVKRNRVKRLVRESYRLNKGILSEASYDIQFVYTASELPLYGSVLSDVVRALEHIAAEK